jgi:branched-chain amino acid transport system substrate-binding protein
MRPTLAPIVLFLLACGGGRDGGEIVLGSHTDLSGVAAAFGVSQANGMRMAVEELNAAGGIEGRPVRLVIEDNQYQVPRAVQAASKLIQRDRIVAMVGALGTPQNNAAFQQQLAAGIPNLFPLTAARQMFQPHHPLKFTAYASYYDGIRAGVKWMADSLAKRRICAMYQDTDYGQEAFEAARDQAEAMGMTLAEATTHKPTDQDFTPQLTQLRAANCDLIVAGVIVRDAIVPYSAARKMGWTGVDFLGTLASYDRSVAGAEGGVTEGFYAMAVIPMPDRNGGTPAMLDWMDRYRQRYGEDPNVGSLYGWQALFLTFEALRRAGPDVTSASLVAALEQIDDLLEPVSGTRVSFSATRHQGANTSFLSQVRGGRWVTLTGPLSF